MCRTYVRFFILLSTLILLSGCLYPESELSKNKVPQEDQLQMIQTAVDEYREMNNGLVPIKTKPAETPIFEKYLIDFDMLKQANLISEIPGNAYENGGIYQYVLITPEDNPRVKLIDLRMTEELRSVVVKLDIYRSKNLYPPFGNEVEPGLFKVDYKKLGLNNEPYVTSPYTNQNLPIVMDTEGQLYIDYRIDLTDGLDKYDHNFTNGDDIRYLLADNTPFVPAYSLPYTIKNGEPVFLNK